MQNDIYTYTKFTLGWLGAPLAMDFRSSGAHLRSINCSEFTWGYSLMKFSQILVRVNIDSRV